MVSSSLGPTAHESNGSGSRRSQDDNDIIMLDHRRRADDTFSGASDWARQANDVETLSSCDSDKSCSPGANKNNRYNISDAHRAYLSSNNGAQQRVQASMFVTTAAARQSHQSQRHPKSGLLKTIERGKQGASNASAGELIHQQQQQSDYFDRLSRMSASDKSTTDDSRAPLDSGGGGSSSRRADSSQCLARQPRFGPHQSERRSTMRNTSISFGAPVARSRSFGRQQQQQRQAWLAGSQQQIGLGSARQQAAEPPMVAPAVGSECDEYQNSELLPMSAEEHWPEPYVDPVEEQPAGDERQLAEEAEAFSYGVLELSSQRQQQYAEPGSIDNYQQQRSQHHHNRHHHHHHQQQQQQQQFQQQRHHHHHNQQQQQKQQKHLVTGGAQDDAYQSNWRTMGRGKQRQQQQQLDYGNGQLNANQMPTGLGGGNNLVQQQQHLLPLDGDEHSAIAAGVSSSTAALESSAASLTRYRSIPSLSGLVVANQAPQGASNWLRWTPPPPPPPLAGFVASDQQQEQADASFQRQATTYRAAQGANEPRSWHRDNHIEAMYVATNNRQQL